AAADIDGDGKPDIVTGTGRGRDWVAVFSDQKRVRGSAAFLSSQAPGIYVAAGRGTIPAAPPSAPSFLAKCTPNLVPEDGWLGGDNGQTIALSYNRVLWL